MILVIQKTFKILELLHAGQEVGLGALAKSAGINKGTLCNILKTMVDLGYVTRGSGGYRLSEQFQRLSACPPARETILQQCRIASRQLAESTRESGVIVTLRGSRVHILAQSQFSRSLMVGASVYDNLSLFHSVSGRAILAFLPKPRLAELIKTTGYPGKEWDNITTLSAMQNALKEINSARLAIMINHADHIKAYAKPVFDAEGEVCGAVGLTVPIFRLEGGNEPVILHELEECASRITRTNTQLHLSSSDWMEQAEE